MVDPKDRDERLSFVHQIEEEIRRIDIKISRLEGLRDGIILAQKVLGEDKMHG